MTPYSRIGRTGVESLTSIFYYCKITHLNDDTNNPHTSVKFFTNAPSSVLIGFLIIGEIALNF